MTRPKPSRPDLIRLLVDTIRDVARIEIRPDDYGENLFGLGLDSVKAIEIINRMEDALDCLVDDTHLRRFTSIEAIVAYFEAMPG